VGLTEKGGESPWGGGRVQDVEDRAQSRTKSRRKPIKALANVTRKNVTRCRRQKGFLGLFLGGVWFLLGVFFFVLFVFWVFFGVFVCVVLGGWVFCCFFFSFFFFCFFFFVGGFVLLVVLLFVCWFVVLFGLVNKGNELH